jgi:hypothetical protein
VYFSNEQSALKVHHLAIPQLDPRGGNTIGKVRPWNEARNEFVVHYPDGMP